jgi:hypothetical protein
MPFPKTAPAIYHLIWFPEFFLMKNLIRLLILLAFLGLPIFASAQSQLTNQTISTSIVITNPPTGTNGEWILFQGNLFIWTNQPALFGQIQTGANRAGCVTNLFTTLSNAWHYTLRFANLSATGFKVSTYLNGSLSLSNSPNWMTNSWATNVITGTNTALQGLGGNSGISSVISTNGNSAVVNGGLTIAISTNYDPLGTAAALGNTVAALKTNAMNDYVGGFQGQFTGSYVGDATLLTNNNSSLASMPVNGLPNSNQTAQIANQLLTNGSSSFSGNGTSLTNTQAGSFNYSGSNNINTYATTAARTNNLITPTGGVQTNNGGLWNNGSINITNGSITLWYTTQAGTEVGTRFTSIGAIYTGGSIGINPSSTLNAQVNHSVDYNMPIDTDVNLFEGGITPLGGLGPNATQLYANILLYENLVDSLQSRATNGAFPFGFQHMSQTSQGGTTYFRGDDTIDNTLVQFDPMIWEVLYSQYTNYTTFQWGPTNVLGCWSTNGYVTFGYMPSPTFQYGTTASVTSTNSIVRAAGNVLPWVSFNTNSLSLGYGGFSQSNQYALLTNTVLGFHSASTGIYTNIPASPLVYLENVINTHWISNNGTIWIWKPASAALFTNNVLIGGTWTNGAGNPTNFSAAYLTTTNQYTYVYTNSAPPVYLYNILTNGQSWSNTYNIKWDGDAIFQTFGTNILTFSNFTAGFGFTITNTDVVNGQIPFDLHILIYPGQTIGLYGNFSMVTNIFSAP